MNHSVPVKIKKLNEIAQIPFHGSDAAAGYDLYASQNCIIPPHETRKISTGLSIAIPDGYWGGIYARSGLATKQGLRPANCVGVIDSDYRGPVIVAIHNDSSEERNICIGDKIAQMIISPFVYWDIEETDTLDETERGSGGFGSTGK